QACRLPAPLSPRWKLGRRWPTSHLAAIRPCCPFGFLSCRGFDGSADSSAVAPDSFVGGADEGVGLDDPESSPACRLPPLPHAPASNTVTTALVAKIIRWRIVSASRVVLSVPTHHAGRRVACVA